MDFPRATLVNPYFCYQIERNGEEVGGGCVEWKFFYNWKYEKKSFQSPPEFAWTERFSRMIRAAGEATIQIADKSTAKQQQTFN